MSKKKKQIKKVAKKKNIKRAAKKPAKKIIRKAIKKTKTSAKKKIKLLSKKIKKNLKKTAKKLPQAKKAINRKTASIKLIATKQKTTRVMAMPKTGIVKKSPVEMIKTTSSVAVSIPISPIQQPITKKSPMFKKTETTIPRAARPRPRPMLDVIVEPDLTALAPSDKATTLLGALEFTPYHPESGETYMNDRQRDHFRKILSAWKLQLMQDVDLTVGHLKEEAEFYADPVDRAAQEEGFNLELRARDRERKLIKKIEQSLDLINSSEYGFCEDCGAEIGIRRLEARPTAVKCIDCKTFQEIREKQVGGES